MDAEVGARFGAASDADQGRGRRRRRAVELWTGGKDSCLALHLVREQRADVEVVALVTFVPSGGGGGGATTEFKAHPQTEMRSQAARLGLPLHFVEVAEPYEASYASGLTWVRDALGATVVVTGDIDLVNGMPNWIEARCEGLGVDVERPLWLKPREWVLQQVLARGIKARFTYLAHPALPREWLGRVIDAAVVQELKAISASAGGVDAAGENGEYHTMVVDAPGFVFPPTAT